MITINFYLKSTKLNKKGLTSVIAQVALNYKKIRKSLFLINPDHWDKENQLVRLDNADPLNKDVYTQYNEILQALRLKTSRLHSRYLLLKRNIPEREILRLFYTDTQIKKLPRKNN